MKYLDFAGRIQPTGTTEILITLIDLSPSMEETDWKPNRRAGALGANEQLIKSKLKYHPDDSMGIIVFGGAARVLHTPVSLNKGADSLRRVLEDPHVPMGTDFTQALELAERCFFGTSQKHEEGFSLRTLMKIFLEPEASGQKIVKDPGWVKRVILLTDGEHNGPSSPLKVATRLKKAGVTIDCIGIGGCPEHVDEVLLKQIASCNPDGSVRYCFIGDQAQLLQKYKTLASHIQVVGKGG